MTLNFHKGHMCVRLFFSSFFSRVFLCLKSKFSSIPKGRQLTVNDPHSSKTFVVSLALYVFLSVCLVFALITISAIVVLVRVGDNSNSKTILQVF